MMLVGYLVLGVALSFIWIVWGYRSGAKLELGLVPVAVLVWPLLLLAYGFGKLVARMEFFDHHERTSRKRRSNRRSIFVRRASFFGKRGNSSHIARL